jgi:hypothetical protein
LLELKTRNAVTKLDRDGIRKAVAKITGSDDDLASKWEDAARELHLLFPDETGVPFKASYVSVGDTRWIALRETQSGDLTHVYIGLLPEYAVPRDHISVLGDARRSLQALRRSARGWRGLRMWRRIFSAADLHINRASSGVVAAPTLSIWRALIADPVLKAATVLVPIAGAHLYRTQAITPGVVFQEIAVLVAILVAIGLMTWVESRRSTQWIIRGA